MNGINNNLIKVFPVLKEDIKKKTATSESLTKEVTEVAKKNGYKKDLEPGSFEDYLKRYCVPID